MKSEILKILQMQQDGKLTQNQAAELLAVLADQAREKVIPPPPPPTGAPGPRGAGAKFGSFVDTVAGVGAQVGRTATVLGGELLSMVHRDEGGNNVTLSKFTAPTGEGYTFRGNSFNVSTIGAILLTRGQVENNSVNASKIARLNITDGRFSQCEVNGSSVNDLTITGSPAGEAITAPGAAPPAATGVRGVAFLGSKVTRTRITGSLMDACTLQGASVKELTLSGGAEMRESRISDSVVHGMALEGSTWKAVGIDDASLSDVTVRQSRWEGVQISGAKVQQSTFAETTWKNVKLRREVGRNCLVEGSTFEKCRFTDAELIGCTFRGTVLRNVEVSGVLVRGVDFSGQTIDGTEAFRKFAGL